MQSLGNQYTSVVDYDKQQDKIVIITTKVVIQPLKYLMIYTLYYQIMHLFLFISDVANSIYG